MRVSHCSLGGPRSNPLELDRYRSLDVERPFRDDRVIAVNRVWWSPEFLVGEIQQRELELKMIILRMIEKREVFLVLSWDPDVSTVSEEHRPGHRFAKNRSERTEARRNLIFGQQINRMSRDTRFPVNTAG